MGIRIISTREFTKPLKVTLQSSGKLGFTRDTAEMLCLSSGMPIRFGKDSDSGKLYIIIMKESGEDTFLVAKAGDYFYLPTTLMFDTLNYDYRKVTYMFDLVRQKEFDDELGGEVYYMKERSKVKGKNNSFEV